MFFVGDRLPPMQYDYPEMEKSAKMWLNCLALGKEKLATHLAKKQL